MTKSIVVLFSLVCLPAASEASSPSRRPSSLLDMLHLRIQDLQCDLVCGDLETDSDYFECRRTCSEPEATRLHLCGLDSCGQACLTACFAHQRPASLIRLEVEGCVAAWQSEAGSARRSILLAQDYWGRYTIVHEDKGTASYTFPAENARKWRQLVVVLVGKSGLNDQVSLKLDTPIQCATPSPSQAPSQAETQQGLSFPYDWILLAVGLLSLVGAVLGLVFKKYGLPCTTPTKAEVASEVLSPVSGSGPISFISGQSSPFVKGSLLAGDQFTGYRSFTDFKIYEDFSFGQVQPQYQRPFSSLV